MRPDLRLALPAAALLLAAGCTATVAPPPQQHAGRRRGQQPVPPTRPGRAAGDRRRARREIQRAAGARGGDRARRGEPRAPVRRARGSTCAKATCASCSSPASACVLDVFLYPLRDGRASRSRPMSRRGARATGRKSTARPASRRCGASARPQGNPNLSLLRDTRARTGGARPGMTMHFADIARQAAADGAITAEEILALRRAGWADGAMKPDEAEAVFALNDALAEPTRRMERLLRRGDRRVRGQRHRAEGLRQRGQRRLADRADRPRRRAAGHDRARAARARARARRSTRPTGSRPMSSSRSSRPCSPAAARRGAAASSTPDSVNDAEAAILRRVLFAPAGDAPGGGRRAPRPSCCSASRTPTLGAANAPEWKQLFVQGVANYLEGVASRSAQLSRERAAELEAFIADDSTSVAGFLGRMAHERAQRVRRGVRREAARARPARRAARGRGGHRRRAAHGSTRTSTPTARSTNTSRR